MSRTIPQGISASRIEPTVTAVQRAGLAWWMRSSLIWYRLIVNGDALDRSGAQRCGDVVRSDAGHQHAQALIAGLLDRNGIDDSAPHQHADPVRKRPQLIQILGDQDNGRAAIPATSDQVVDRFGRADVDATGWRASDDHSRAP